MSAWERFLDTFFKPAVAAQYWPDILKGALVTVEIAAAVLSTGLLLGLLLAILLIYFGLPSVGSNLPSFVVLWLVLSFVLPPSPKRSSGLGSPPRPGASGRPRARRVSLSPARLSTSSLPRRSGSACPPLTNRTIAITKNTALGTVIGV
jgi:polar amino acid transport system permease protein